MLAGVSVDYYVRLEQGRDLTPSESVVDALARALRLDDTERAHLIALARPPRNSFATPDAVAPTEVRPSVQMLMDGLDQPAFVLGRRMDILATNRMARAADRFRRPAAARAQPRSLDLPRPRDPRALRRLARRGARQRRNPAPRRRPAPRRSAAARAHRRALDGQSRVPHVVGRARRGHPQLRHEALPAPRRRRDDDPLRGDATGRCGPAAVPSTPSSPALRRTTRCACSRRGRQPRTPKPRTRRPATSTTARRR